MALNALELKMISGLIARCDRRPPSILCLGYPDLLCLQESLVKVGLTIDWEAIPKRSNASKIWSQHNRGSIAHLPMLDTKSTLSHLGASTVVVDAFAWGGEDQVFDLNYPLTNTDYLASKKFDIILDPGTLEHCFNIAQAFANVDRLLAHGGFVYHQAAAAFPNHGFWSISPTAFFDFYECRRYQLGQPYYWQGAEDELGLIPRIAKVDPFLANPSCPTPMIVSYIFRKSAKEVTPSEPFPVQRCYSGLSRQPTIIDYFAECITN